VVAALDLLQRELVAANRILANEGVLDTFGHVSVRHPEDANRFFLSRSLAPELVTAADIIEFGLDCQPVRRTDVRLYAERVIHGSIYRLRSDVKAVCHYHAPALMPFCVTDVALVAVSHLGATMGRNVAVWDSRHDFGDTNLLVATDEQGTSLARALGPDWLVLMRRHGATVAGRSLREVVFRSIYANQNADILHRALVLGKIEPLTPGEVEAAAAVNLQPLAIDRAWECWKARMPDQAAIK
jgi:HCOMODA/2-hydroxy-3-carboxy-muconic semialdehyde decarboxylase